MSDTFYLDCKICGNKMDSIPELDGRMCDDCRITEKQAGLLAVKLIMEDPEMKYKKISNKFSGFAVQMEVRDKIKDLLLSKDEASELIDMFKANTQEAVNKLNNLLHL